MSHGIVQIWEDRDPLDSLIVNDNNLIECAPLPI